MDGTPKDPLEGFHFDDFDDELKAITIRIHEQILNDPRQKDALLSKLAEVLSFDDNIHVVDIKPRD